MKYIDIDSNLADFVNIIQSNKEIKELGWKLTSLGYVEPLTNIMAIMLGKNPNNPLYNVENKTSIYFSNQDNTKTIEVVISSQNTIENIINDCIFTIKADILKYELLDNLEKIES